MKKQDVTIAFRVSEKTKQKLLGLAKARDKENLSQLLRAMIRKELAEK